MFINSPYDFEEIMHIINVYGSISMDNRTVEYSLAILKLSALRAP